MSNFSILETSRFALRKFTQDDLENVYKGLSHPDVIKYYGVSFNSLEATQEQLDWFTDHEANKTGLWLAVCDKDTGEFYGAGGVNDIEKEHLKGEIGFWLLPEHWGKGIMKEVMPELCNFIFDHFKLRRIEGFVEAGNDNCRKAMSKLNFVHEGTMIDCEKKNGEFISVAIYALLNNGN